jgi:hypothetical protein
MDDRDGELRVQRWSALLLVVGMLGLLPYPPIRGAFDSVEESLLSARRWVGRALGAGAPAEAEAVEGRPDARVVELLARSRASLLPPRSTGWQRDGGFCVVAVGGERSPAALGLLAGAVPTGEPVFSGRVLVGTTALDKRTQRTYVKPLLAKGTRIPACAGVPGRREVRFIAVGDGSDTLRVAYPDNAQPIRDGDLVWAIDAAGTMAGALLVPDAAGAVAPFIGGAELGRIARGALPAGAERDDWRVRPSVDLDELAEVAVRYPAGLPGPTETDLAPLAVRPTGAAVHDDRRRGAWLGVGRELGVVPGCLVASGPCVAGVVVRSGWHAALVRRVDDPGFRCRALVLADGRCLPWTIEVAGSADGRLLLRGAPALAGGDGALVVTAASAMGAPEGLLLGVLENDGGQWRLRVEPALLERPQADSVWVVQRPPGPWSDEG